METIIIMDAAAKRADLEKKALEKKILEELEKKQMENAIQKRFETELVRVSKMIEEGETSYFELNYLMDEIHNYKEIKNYLHNELGITKEYIDSIIVKTVQDEVKKIFNNEGYVRDVIIKTIDREVRREVCGESGWHTIHDMNSMIKDEILSIIVKEVKDKVIISLKED